MAGGPGATIEPAHLGVKMYGQFCAYFACLPSAYYCVARFPNDLEEAACCGALPHDIVVTAA
jgi:hypothetical protein